MERMRDGAVHPARQKRLLMIVRCSQHTPKGDILGLVVTVIFRGQQPLVHPIRTDNDDKNLQFCLVLFFCELGTELLAIPSSIS